MINSFERQSDISHHLQESCNILECSFDLFRKSNNIDVVMEAVM